MLKSLFKKKTTRPSAEEILALSAARAALVDRMGGMLSRIPTVEYVLEPCPIYDAPQEDEAQAA